MFNIREYTEDLIAEGMPKKKAIFEARREHEKRKVTRTKRLAAAKEKHQTYLLR